MTESYQVRWINCKHWLESHVAEVNAIIPALLKEGSAVIELESTNVKCDVVSGAGNIDLDNLDAYCTETYVLVQGNNNKWMILSAFG
jgi:hypothetical protein